MRAIRAQSLSFSVYATLSHTISFSTLKLLNVLYNLSNFRLLKSQFQCWTFASEFDILNCHEKRLRLQKQELSLSLEKRNFDSKGVNWLWTDGALKLVDLNTWYLGRIVTTEWWTEWKNKKWEILPFWWLFQQFFMLKLILNFMQNRYTLIFV